MPPSLAKYISSLPLARMKSMPCWSGCTFAIELHPYTCVRFSQEAFDCVQPMLELLASVHLNRFTAPA